MNRNGHATMSRNVPLADQCQQVVSDIETALRNNIPVLSSDPREFFFEFTIHIRDGSMQQLDTDTNDETFVRVPATVLRLFHQLCRWLSLQSTSTPVEENSTERTVQDGIHALTNWLVKDLRQRAVKGYHGAVIIRVSVKQNSFSFSTLVRRQRKYSWC